MALINKTERATQKAVWEAEDAIAAINRTLEVRLPRIQRTEMWRLEAATMADAVRTDATKRTSRLFVAA